MLGSKSISRLLNYYRRHGLRESVKRAGLFVRQSLTFGKMVVFYWDLTCQSDGPKIGSLPDYLTVEQKNSRTGIDACDWNQIVNFWNIRLTEPAFTLRLQQGATIWLLRCEGQLCGYGWSVSGRTIESYYYPLGADDAIVYDFLVFPEFRGRRFLPYLLNYVLSELSREGIKRGHFDIKVWNRPSLLGTAKTDYPRHLLGFARMRTFFGRTYVEWLPSPRVEAERVQVLTKLVTAA